jgi:hypothetical protein
MSPLGRADNPRSARNTLPKGDVSVAKQQSDAQVEKAKENLLDAGAGSPPTMEAAAEALPEKDEVQKAHKDAMTADSTDEEVKAKVRVVKASPDAAETPSGGALIAVQGISDPVEQGEAYAREKSARRFGSVPADSK